MINIQISEENYKALQNQAVPFQDNTPDDVLTRILQTSGIKPATEIITAGQPKKSKAGFRVWTKTLLTIIGSMGAMSINEVWNELDRNWSTYLSKPKTKDEKVIVQSGPRGMIEAWKHKVFVSLQRMVNDGRLREYGGRYSIVSTTGATNDTHSSINRSEVGAGQDGGG
jgi:hypothetical protein